MMLLKMRIGLLTPQGVAVRMPFQLKQDFRDMTGDKWIFDGLVSTIKGVQEMHDPKRGDAVGETLSPAKKKRGRKSKTHLAEFNSWKEPFEDETLTLR